MRKISIFSGILILSVLSGCQQMQQMDFSQMASHSISTVLQSKTGKQLSSSAINSLLNSSFLKDRLSSLLGNNLSTFIGNFGSEAEVKKQGGTYYMSGSKDSKDSSAFMWDSTKNILSTLIVKDGKVSAQTEGKNTPAWPSSIASLASKFM